MSSPFLSRHALARVLQSLLETELKAARGGVFRDEEFPHRLSGVWPEDVKIAGDGSHSLGCDSLEVIGLAAATNEMFHLSEANLDIEVFSGKTFGDWLDIIEAGWQAGVVHITFRTSGSTGTPKRCTHEFTHLQVEVRHLAELFVTRRRAVALALAHHIYGFIFTAMLPDQLGIDVLSHKRVRQVGPDHWLRRGDLVVSIPEHWEFLNRTLTKWPAGVNGVVSTAPCSRRLIDSLMERGLHGMTEIYGSTETSGIGTRAWPEETYRLMPHWQPASTNNRWKTDLLHNSGMQVKLMDRIQFRDDGSFYLTGRLDGSVQVGGTNVYPARIASLLVSRPGVADAAVRLMRPDEGVRLKAFIVPNSELPQGILVRELESWIETHLATAERPKKLTFGLARPIDALSCEPDW
ncbi:AMP-binding protein [Tunturiibacter gelidoferens]|uniref:4-coumarate--CoA ligase (Photoactive yellow protein activation family) n=1 Tax=Tunturiibacter gelidiferens TaxID=3069689 RepID=A0A9X0U6I9_9BACT|nr:AMP-binding protein [Edaphobacter lichenicola]MBB5331689.1 4-coumarate--CoA ligase (photoactive yellow protein activation family) [Edaphobacter lichenicola]